MSRANLTLIASLVACRHGEVEPTRPAPAAEIAPAHAPAWGRAAPTIVRPSVEPRAPPSPDATPLRTDVTPDRDLLDRRCMSRAGCRWTGEQERPRVTRKPPQPTAEPATTEPPQ